ncbi:sulfatase-like hydrolase/transferase [Mariniflexile sp.]|uniref:sulfatase-like hydrolase/transferase n=1 Tax=Mariniflexile sp. TaxID=1979402 RepID=UPI00356189F5
MKSFLNIFCVALVISSCGQKIIHKVDNTTTKQPNIIFIMADDHATQAISPYGHPISKLAPTPNIYRIATKGALFKSNFCTNSIYGPSRALVLTGKFSHVNGFRMHGDKFDGNQQTFPKLLQKAGYNTGIIGKWHLDGLPQGFNYWKILTDQGNYYNPDVIRENENTKRIDTTRIEGYVTDIITDDAIKYLDNIKNNAMHETNLSGKVLAEWEVQRYLQEYLATIAAVNEGVGKILNFLDAIYYHYNDHPAFHMVKKCMV